LVVDQFRDYSRRVRASQILARADKAALVISSWATMLAGSAPFLGSPDEGIPIGFALVAPFVAVAFSLALGLLCFKRLRGGAVRALLGSGASALAIAGIVYTQSVSPSLLVIAYWLPALLSLTAAWILEWSRRAATRAL
jgi:hypothetical protein